MAQCAGRGIPGAVIHGLQYVASVAGRIANAGSGSQELFYVRRLAGNKMYFYPGGNEHQAWAAAASLYFRRVVSLPYLSTNNGRRSDLTNRVAA